jgi:small conductance mechanosensitive channel
MNLPMQIVDEEDISRADSLFRVGLEQRVESLSRMSWGDRVQVLSGDLLHAGMKLVVAVVIYIVGRWMITILSKLLDRMFERWKVDWALRTFIRTTTKTILYFILLYIVIVWLGVNTSLFVALVAAAALAVGMAMSGVFQNVAGGVLVLLTRPFGCGDWIEMNGRAGRVMDIRLFNTVIRTVDNCTVLLPNGSVSTSMIDNHFAARTRRVEWVVQLDLGVDFDEVSRILKGILAADVRVNTFPPPEVVLSRISSSSLEILVHGWVSSMEYWNVYYAVNLAIYRTLPARGIDLGSAQSLEVTLMSPEAATPVAPAVPAPVAPAPTAPTASVDTALAVPGTPPQSSDTPQNGEGAPGSSPEAPPQAL